MKKLIVLTLFSIAMIPPTFANATPSEREIEIVIDDYKKVDSSELTPKVIEQILIEYPTSKLAGVYKNAKGQFKLIMVLSSGTRRTVYIDQFGRWFTPKKK